MTFATNKSGKPSLSKSPTATPIPYPTPATPAFSVTSVKVPSRLLWNRRFQYTGESLVSDGMAAPFTK